MSKKTQENTAGLSRRSFVKGAGTLAAASMFGGVAPYVMSSEKKVLRYLGTAVNQDTKIGEKAKEDLGITIEYIPVTTDEVTKRILTQPNSFDLVDTEYFSLKKLVPSGNLIGMNANRIKEFDNIVTAFTKGEVAGKKIGDQGTAPKKVFYKDGEMSKTFSSTPTEWVTLIPTVYNADTLGIRPDLIGRPINSWAELLNPEFKGKASILNIPSIGIMDAAMVVEAMGEYKYPDKGNMTKKEIDLTMKIMTEAKKAGQFRAFWSDFNESVNLMASGEVVIQSMWSPAITKVRSQGIPCIYQPLKEGYRSWGGGLGLSRNLSGIELDAAYEYINWYLSGWVGGYLMRQGYYSAVPSTSKQFMSEDEWGYWYEGKASKGDIVSPTGAKLAGPGEVRDGGSFLDRMGSVVCWNSVMDENQYMVRKWNEFIAA